MLFMRSWTALIAGLLVLCQAGATLGDEVLLRTAILNVSEKKPLPISRLDLPPRDLGFAGGAVATKDNQTTGRFLGHKYETLELKIKPEAVAAEIEKLAAEGVQTVVTMATADVLLAISDAAARHGMLVLNATATDDRLRNAECRSNVLHIAPSRAQIADGLAQYMVWKKWTDWMLVHGSHPEDARMADAYRRAARKFGIKITEERIFEDTGGSRRTDSGHVLVQKQIPVFMQRADDHDVVVVADESQVFGQYIPYHGWDPRPVVGDAGLIASMWHPGHESWGATQLQRRFEKSAKRRMRDQDYLIWLALRSLGEAVTRTAASDPETLKAYLLSEEFQLAGFKGQALSFRPWNNQMRHGVIMGDGKLVVTVSPQEEFLHQRTRLDTLGYDEPESTCSFPE